MVLARPFRCLRRASSVDGNICCTVHEITSFVLDCGGLVRRM